MFVAPVSDPVGIVIIPTSGNIWPASLLTLLDNANRLPPSTTSKEVESLAVNKSPLPVSSTKLETFNFSLYLALLTFITKKLLDFVEKYKIDNNLDNDESKILTSFLKDCIDRKKLQRVKDVVYDKINGSIKEIPALAYTKSIKHSWPRLRVECSFESFWWNWWKSSR